MLSNYPDHELYFSQPISSVSTFYIGKSKIKLNEIKVEVHKEYLDKHDVEIDSNNYCIETTYIAYEVSGAISYKDVSEGAHTIQASCMLINALIAIFEEYCGDHKEYFYENDYDRGWSRRAINELFWYLVRDTE